MTVVGREWVPWVGILSTFLLVPLILLYSQAVDHVKRYQLLIYYSALFGCLGLFCVYFIGHPTIGIANTVASPYRFFGWFFYFFIESYSPFVVSVFWAFTNSIFSPDDARKNYSFIVTGSKLGGMFTAGLAWYLFSISAKGHHFFSDVITHQIVLMVASAMLLLIPLVVLTLIKVVPSQNLHGYEAAYKLEHGVNKKKKESVGIFAGIDMFVKYPYVFGMFGLVFFYEVINKVLSYLRLGVAEAHSANTSELSGYLFEIMFKTHVVGLIVAVFGTRALFQRLGTTFCLMLVPLMTGFFLLYLMIETTPQALANAYVLFKAVHYALSWPVREALYIPTVKEIKFKSRSWIDAFGSKIARSSGSVFNIFATQFGDIAATPIHSFFFAVLIGSWCVVAFFLGKRFEWAVKHNEVIGSEAEDNTVITKG
jgi:AAA family ATP:ADP antiporter